MELQVMILDDEYIILDGLCSFPWSDYGYRISATARNGLEGLEKLEQAKPDLILTDVKMPGMDGLDFAEKAHEIYPNAVIVILTGYDSFAYAQKAISIGVEEYLLKPVDYDELKAMAARIAGEIHAKKEKQQEIRDLKKYFNRSVPQLRSKFAGNLLYGRIQGKGVVKEQAESLNLTIEKYIVCVGRKVVGENKIHTGDKWIEEVACINIFEEIFNDFGIHVLSDYNTATAEYNFILLFEKEEENAVCMEKALQACSKIQVEVERYLKAHMNFGLSDVEVDEYQANAQYRKAQTACRQCVYLGTNIILRYEDLQYEKQTDFVITSGEKTHFMMTLFQDSFEKAEDELHQMFRNAPEDVSPVKFAAMDLLLGCMKFPYICAVDSEIHNKNWNLSVLQDGIKRICQCENTEEVLNCLLNLFGTLIKQNTEGTDERNRKLVQSVLSYIEKNYSGDLSMDDLTEKFHVSRTYISRLLKKYAGKSFLEYLTDVRFQQVEKLIADNKYKQYEIAEMVGYKDFGYYIKVFKKRYGITPNEFRKYI